MMLQLYPTEVRGHIIDAVEVGCLVVKRSKNCALSARYAIVVAA
jgi:hypothetical protein